MSLKEKIRNFLNSALFYISVPKCVCCNEKLDIDDLALCKSCKAEYDALKARNCSICSLDLNRCTCSCDYLERHYVKKLIKVYRYIYDDTLPTNRVIYSFKRDNRSDVLEFIKSELTDAISASIQNPEQYIFTSVPRRKKSIRKYGIDHAQLLAKALAKHFKTEYKALLISKSKSPQKETRGNERVKNVNFKLKNDKISLKGKKVFLVDDVVTTGASMRYAATLIRGLGTREIVGVTISIAYKDSYTPFEYLDRYIHKKQPQNAR